MPFITVIVTRMYNKDSDVVLTVLGMSTLDPPPGYDDSCIDANDLSLALHIPYSQFARPAQAAHVMTPAERRGETIV